MNLQPARASYNARRAEKTRLEASLSVRFRVSLVSSVSNRVEKKVGNPAPPKVASLSRTPINPLIAQKIPKAERDG